MTILCWAIRPKERHSSRTSAAGAVGPSKWRTSTWPWAFSRAPRRTPVWSERRKGSGPWKTAMRVSAERVAGLGGFLAMLEGTRRGSHGSTRIGADQKRNQRGSEGRRGEDGIELEGLEGRREVNLKETERQRRRSRQD